VFDCDGYERELRPILDESLRGGSLEPLRAFIQRHREALKNPHDGQPLAEDWESRLGSRDAHQYGDLAMTRFYEPSSNVGLGEEWDATEDVLTGVGVRGAILLGKLIGPRENLFDPREFQVCYLQSARMVQENSRRLEELLRRRLDLEATLAQAVRLFEPAAEIGRGLYIVL
jgi:hypothetical protein